MSTFFSQFHILLARNARLFVADMTGMLLALVQAPVIALFIILALWGSARDCSSSDAIMRNSHAFIQAVEKDRKNTEVMYDDYRIVRAKDYLQNLKGTEGLLSPAHAQARATVFFVLIAASIWMGLLGSCKEIVSEWKVIHRESHVTFSTGAYVASKLCVLGGVLLFQVFLLTVITLFALMRDEFCWSMLWCHFGVNWLTGFCACTLGLLMSCVIGSIRWALALVPVIMMPQILMGGLLRPPAQILPEQRSSLRDFCSMCTFQRWAFEAELNIDTRLHSGTVAGGTPDVHHRVALLAQDTQEESLIYQPKCLTPALDEYFFQGRPGPLSHRLKYPLIVLTGFAALLALLTDFCLALRIFGANCGLQACV